MVKQTDEKYSYDDYVNCADERWEIIKKKLTEKEKNLLVGLIVTKCLQMENFEIC